MLVHAASHPALWGLAIARGLAGRPSRWTLPAAVLVVGQVGYVLAVGGDFKPTGRFLIPVLVPLAMLAGESAAGLVRARSPVVRWSVLLVVWGALLVGTLRMAQQDLRCIILEDAPAPDTDWKIVVIGNIRECF